jgi:nitrite reductase/ring-hydroxylating ferredoxin subunit
MSSQGYVFVCIRSELPVRGKKTVHVGAVNVLVIVCDTGLYAIEDRDPQTGQRIAHGKVLNCEITSPNNGARYNLRTGQYAGGGLSPLQSHWLTVFPIQEIDDEIHVSLARSAAAAS